MGAEPLWSELLQHAVRAICTAVSSVRDCSRLLEIYLTLTCSGVLVTCTKQMGRVSALRDRFTHFSGGLVLIHTFGEIGPFSIKCCDFRLLTVNV